MVRFLRKLAAAGQAILCTIHQPNAMLFEHFGTYSPFAWVHKQRCSLVIISDRLLLLQKGGETVYFGDIGKDCNVLTDYFARNGAPCPPDANRKWLNVMIRDMLTTTKPT